jgi:aminoglycoside phosphotransferase (APT) family kinase protein
MKESGQTKPASTTREGNDEFEAVLRRDGVLRGPNARLTPLAGGVSSEIYRVADGGQTFIVKRALARLRVKDEWTADLSRNVYEQRYMKYVGQFLPEAVPGLLSVHADRGYFVMEDLGVGFGNWKRLLMRGEVRLEHAERAGAILGKIHARSAGDEEAARLFDSTRNFIQLRIDPYLTTVGERHPDLQATIEAESQRLASTRECLVHGDFSPKNIMIGGERMVLLDCEVGWYGDGAFDVAFLLTHLLLKALYHAPRQIGLDEMCWVFWRRYGEEADGVLDMTSLEGRVARLLPMLMLARVDGKSPVEYLQAEDAERVRRFVRTRLQGGPCELDEILHDWFAALGKWKAKP